MTISDKPGLAEDVEPDVDAHHGIDDAAGPAHNLVLWAESRSAGIGHILAAGIGWHHLVVIGMYSPAGPDLNNPVGIGLIVLAGTGTHRPAPVLLGLVHGLHLRDNLDVDLSGFQFWHISRNFQDVEGMPIDLLEIHLA